MLNMEDFDLNKLFPPWLKVMGTVVVLGVVLSILWKFPQWQAKHAEESSYQRVTLEDAYRRTLAQILGGLALLYGLYLTQRRIVATEESVRVAQEGQVTERFTRAIEQLGHKEMAIRLGGIYSLERIAKDSEKDHGPVMEVLTAYVREKATNQGSYAEEAAKMPTTDIQAILTVIGRRKPIDIKRLSDLLDLSSAHLAGATLHGADLSRVVLTGADLHEATLTEATLRGADLTGATLREATLPEATLHGATLRGVDLSKAILREATLTEADLSEATLTGADLTEATLTGADLTEATLTGTALSGVENLTEEQILSAKNWREAYLPGYLNLSKPPAA